MGGICKVNESKFFGLVGLFVFQHLQNDEQRTTKQERTGPIFANSGISYASYAEGAKLDTKTLVSLLKSPYPFILYSRALPSRERVGRSLTKCRTKGD